MANTTNETQVPLAQIAQVLEQFAPDADGARASSLETLAALRAARAVQLTRERARMARVAGAGHPFLALLDQRVEANQTFGRVVEEAADQARAGVPKPDPTAWTVHGRVRDAGLNPVRKLTVGLADDKGTWRRQWPTASTAADGGFVLRLPMAMPAPAAAPPQIPSVSLVVMDAAKKNVLLLDTLMLAPRAGAVDFRDLVLPASPAAKASPSTTRRPATPPKTPSRDTKRKR